MRRLLPLMASPRGVAFSVLALFTVASVFGYWNFALHPERLPTTPLALSFFSISFKFFAQLHILLAAVALVVVLVGAVGWRWWPALLAVYGLSFLSEHMGTGYGIPFGGYGYTGLLGFKLGGRVPALIPLSWFLMAVPSWLFARRAAPTEGARLLRLGLGAFWLTVWDLALDPAMSYLTPYWLWEDSGPYYGMPWINLLGWFVTGLALMAALEALAGRTGLERVPLGWAGVYYALVMALPVGMVAAAGLWTAVGVSLMGVGVALTFSLLAGGVAQTVASRQAGEPTPAGAR